MQGAPFEPYEGHLLCERVPSAIGARDRLEGPAILEQQGVTSLDEHLWGGGRRGEHLHAGRLVP